MMNLHTRNVLTIVGLVVGLFVLLELALQVRSHIRYGQSIFNLASEQTLYIFNDDLGLKTLRPSEEMVGSEITIQSNSFGLRSSEISITKPSNEFRIAVVGASTVMGAYAKTNQDTFPAILEDKLNRSYAGTRIEVLNAGIAGYTLEDQAKLIDRLLVKLNVDLIFIYTGINDVAGYCRTKASDKEVALRKPVHASLTLPNWLLSVDLIKKNTVWLRPTGGSKGKLLDPSSLDLTDYGKKISLLLSAAKKVSPRVIVSTNAKSYRRSQALSEQRSLSETARFYNPCFDLAGLHRVYDLHNKKIKEEASGLGVPVLPLHELVPGGAEYFVDASHFSRRGEEAAADEIAEYVMSQVLRPDSS